MAATITIADLQDAVSASLPVGKIAEKFGVTPSAITQAMEAHGMVYPGGISAEHKSLDEKYDALEKAALDRMEGVLSFVSNPMQLARIINTLNGAKRRAGPLRPAEEAGGTARPVNICMPTLVQNYIQVNNNNEVVSVAQKDLVTMPAENVKEMLRNRTPELPAPEIKKLGDIL